MEAIRDIIRRAPDQEDLAFAVRCHVATLRRMNLATEPQPEDRWTEPMLWRWVRYERETLKTNRLALTLIDCATRIDESRLSPDMRNLVRQLRAAAAQLSGLVMAILGDTSDDHIDLRERADLTERVSDARNDLAEVQAALSHLDRNTAYRSPTRVG
jgi:hypothetical protein